MICFYLCLVGFITRGLQNNDHSTFSCRLAQTKFKKRTNLENCVRLFMILSKKCNIYSQTGVSETMSKKRSNTGRFEN